MEEINLSGERTKERKAEEVASEPSPASKHGPLEEQKRQSFGVDSFRSHQLKANCAAMLSEFKFPITTIKDNKEVLNSWAILFEYDLPPFGDGDGSLPIALEYFGPRSFLRFSSEIQLAEEHLEYILPILDSDEQMLRRMTLELTRECAAFDVDFYWSRNPENKSQVAVRTERLHHPTGMCNQDVFLHSCTRLAWALMNAARLISSRSDAGASK
ncbi:MAG: hypothetical protein KY455_07920 [Euryarchaeota archaeon]|nr:hypothetical protein [Euryarchaeota archaeon]